MTRYITYDTPMYMSLALRSGSIFCKKCFLAECNSRIN